MKRIAVLPLMIVLLILLVGCNESSDSDASGEILVTESKWNDQGSSEEEKNFDDVKKGDVLSESNFGTLTVKKITDDYVVISLTEGFVEMTGKGINMNADDLTRIKLKKGESITIASKSYDAGITITIQYKEAAEQVTTEAVATTEQITTDEKAEDAYAGVYLDYENNEPNLSIKANGDGTYEISIGIFRLAVFEDGVGTLSENGLEFTATDPAGNPIKGVITLEGNEAVVTFTDSTWELIENGTSFRYHKPN